MEKACDDGSVPCPEWVPVNIWLLNHAAGFQDFTIRGNREEDTGSLRSYCLQVHLALHLPQNKIFKESMCRLACVIGSFLYKTCEKQSIMEC